MTYRVYFTANGTDDYYDIEGDSIEEIRELSIKWLSSRGLTVDNETGSEEL